MSWRSWRRTLIYLPDQRLIKRSRSCVVWILQTTVLSWMRKDGLSRSPINRWLAKTLILILSSAENLLSREWYIWSSHFVEARHLDNDWGWFLLYAWLRQGICVTFRFNAKLRLRSRQFLLTGVCSFDRLALYRTTSILQVSEVD